MLTEKELSESIKFFQQKDIDILENQARKINDKQPNFTAMIYTFEMLGYTRDMTEEFLESIFVIYYAYTELLKFEINTIGEDQIAYNINLNRTIVWPKVFSYFQDSIYVGFKTDIDRIVRALSL
jgi:hypothetical protein